MRGPCFLTLLLLPGLWLVQGCNRPHAKPDEMIGTYQPTEATLQYMAYCMGYLPKSPPRVEVGSNFSITVYNMPDAWPTTYGTSKTSSNYFSGRGLWSFSDESTPYGSLLHLNLEELQYSPETPTNAPPFLMAINLTELCGKKPHLVLRFLIGDGNHGGFVFVRQPGTNELSQAR